MDLEIINKLYLELSQVATAKTGKEIDLEDQLELCRLFLVECKSDTDDRISPALKRHAARLFENLFKTSPGVSSVTHGIDCRKVRHGNDGYLHNGNDDTPYDVDGLKYCGRCHQVL